MMKETIDLVQPSSHGGLDMPYQNLISNVESSIKTSYEMFSTINNNENSLDSLFVKVWKWEGPTRIRDTL